MHDHGLLTGRLDSSKSLFFTALSDFEAFRRATLSVNGEGRLSFYLVFLLVDVFGVQPFR